MKLITNFRDYYDSIAKQDTDPQPVWIRNRKESECLKQNDEILPFSHYFSIIGFAGKLYPCLETTRDTGIPRKMV